MTIKDLRAIIAPQTAVNIWTRKDNGELKEVISGTCKRLPEGLNRFDVIILEAPDTDVIDVTI